MIFLVVLFLIKLNFRTKNNWSNYNTNIKEQTTSTITSQQNTQQNTQKYITIGNIEVMSYDIGKFGWIEANEECSKLGDSWRLPTIEELKILYKYRKKLGRYHESEYWSSSKSWDCYENQRKGLDFGHDAHVWNNYMHDDCWVRAVRTKY